MPRALHNIICERSLIQRATSMGTRGGDGIELLALAQYDHRHARGCHAIECVFHDAIRRQHRFVVLTGSLPGGMVDTGALGEDHLTAQVAGIEHTGQPHETKNGGSDPIAWTSDEPEYKGDKVEDRRARV